MGSDIGKRQIMEFVKMNGLEFKRSSGSHKIYKTKCGDTIALKDKMAKPVLQRIAKQYHLNLKI